MIYSLFPTVLLSTLFSGWVDMADCYHEMIFTFFFVYSLTNEGNKVSRNGTNASLKLVFIAPRGLGDLVK